MRSPRAELIHSSLPICAAADLRCGRAVGKGVVVLAYQQLRDHEGLRVDAGHTGVMQPASRDSVESAIAPACEIDLFAIFRDFHSVRAGDDQAYKSCGVHSSLDRERPGIRIRWAKR
jgi:hypothetical protein